MRSATPRRYSVSCSSWERTSMSSTSWWSVIARGSGKEFTDSRGAVEECLDATGEANRRPAGSRSKHHSRMPAFGFCFPRVSGKSAASGRCLRRAKSRSLATAGATRLRLRIRSVAWPLRARGQQPGACAVCAAVQRPPQIFSTCWNSGDWWLMPPGPPAARGHARR